MKAVLRTSLMGMKGSYPHGATIDTSVPGSPLSEAELRRYIDEGLATPVNDEPETPEKRAADRKEKR